MEWRFDSAQDIYPSAMRSEVMASLHAHGMPESDFAAAELIYGELISNAIRHARGKIAVALDWTGEFATLTVYDEAPFVERDVQLPEDPLAESGRGLYIVQRLARQFVSSPDRSGGTFVCATLPVKRRSVPSRSTE